MPDLNSILAGFRPIVARAAVSAPSSSQQISPGSDSDASTPLAGDRYTPGGEGRPTSQAAGAKRGIAVYQNQQVDGTRQAESESGVEESADDAGEQGVEKDTSPGAPKDMDGEPLSMEEIAQVKQLQKRDSEVRAHEQAHLAAAGGLASSGMSLSYRKGPDGKSYAVGGEVHIDTSKGSTPRETITKMARVRAAALAPADPSPQDRKVAAAAASQMSQARAELQLETNQDKQGAVKDAAMKMAKGEQGEGDSGEADHSSAPAKASRGPLLAAYGRAAQGSGGASQISIAV